LIVLDLLLLNYHCCPCR